MKRKKDKAAHQSGHYPKKTEISLFDLPKLMYCCMDVLRKHQISRVYPQKLIVSGNKVQLHIQYFDALDGIKAEMFHRGVDLNIGLFMQYRLPVSEGCEIVWTKETGIWGKRYAKAS